MLHSAPAPRPRAHPLAALGQLSLAPPAGALGRTGPKWLIAAIVLGLLVGLPWIVDALGMPGTLGLATSILISAIAAASLNLALGYAGLISFGHAAFFGIGAYTVGILNAQFAAGEPFLGFIPGTNQLLITLPAAMLVGGLLAAAIGALSLRTSGVQFIMITLAFAQMLFFLFVSLKVYGGDDGLSVRRRNILPGLPLRDDTSFYFVCLAVAVAIYLLIVFIVRSDFGFVLGGIRQNERRVAAVGFAPLSLQARRVRPIWHGNERRGRADGELSALRQPGHDALDEIRRLHDHGDLRRRRHAGRTLDRRRGLRASRNMAHQRHRKLAIHSRPTARRRRALHARRSARRAPPLPAPARMSEQPLLAVRGLTKRFGGLLATDNVDLDVRDGEIHALIGPNGAGKTTLIAQLTGELRPDAGEIHFDSTRIDALPAHARVQRGLARTFQITQLLPAYTALDNVAIAIGETRHTRASARAGAAEHLAASGLAHRAATRVDILSQGERKQLELAVALAMKPRMALLDEPMAGLGRSESVGMIDRLAALKGEIAILLVEHDLDAVFALADRISVLVYGKIVVTGTPDEIRANKDVQTAYLGDGDV